MNAFPIVIGAVLLGVLAMAGCISAPVPDSLRCPPFERPPLPLDAMPGLGSCAGSAVVAAWIHELRESIIDEWHPPHQAWAMREVRAVFVLARDGSVRDSCIQSGDDREAALAVLDALQAHRLERPPPLEAACVIGIRLQATFKVLRP